MVGDGRHGALGGESDGWVARIAHACWHVDAHAPCAWAWVWACASAGVPACVEAWACTFAGP